MGNMNDRRKSVASHSVERGGEIARLKEGSLATMEELQEFLGEMRGKSPQQVLGLVAASGLTSGVLISTLATAVILFAFTAVPYFVYGDTAAAEAEKKKAAAAAVAAEKAAADAEAEKAEAEAAKAGGGAANSKEAAVKAMTKEFDETKGSTGDEMPDIDNLLK